MLRNYKILVVEDDVERRANLKVVLDFIGEPAVFSSQSDWEKDLAHNKWLCVVLGIQRNDTEILACLRKIQKTTPHRGKVSHHSPFQNALGEN